MKATKGFTLVELIVVITILAILATIGFLSLQGYTQDAKETKTVANLRTVASSLVNESAIAGKGIGDYISVDASAAMSTGYVNSGTAVDFADVNEYKAGKVNAAALKIDGSKFFDKDSANVEQAFRAAVVTFAEQVNGRDRYRSMFQVAGTLKTATGNSALVEGSYAEVATSDMDGLIKSTETTETAVKAGTTYVPYAL